MEEKKVSESVLPLMRLGCRVSIRCFLCCLIEFLFSISTGDSQKRVVAFSVFFTMSAGGLARQSFHLPKLCWGSSTSLLTCSSTPSSFPFNTLWKSGITFAFHRIGGIVSGSSLRPGVKGLSQMISISFCSLFVG